MNQRTGGLTAICVVAIVVGSLGVLSGLSTLAALTLGAKLERAVAQVQPQQDSDLQQAQQEAAAASARFRPFQWALVACQIPLSIMMVVGAILAWRLHRLGRRWLLTTFVVALAFVPSRGVVTGLALAETGLVMEQAMQRAAKNASPAGARRPPGIDQMMGGLARTMVVMQWVVLAGMVLLRCVFYLIGAWYLTRPRVAALFAPTPINPERS